MMTVVYDAGWAWVVLVAAFLSVFMVGLNVYSVGVFHVVFLETYHGSNAKTSTVASLALSMVFLGGPIGSLLINRMNCRVCVMVGGLMMFVGMSTSALSNSLDMLLVTYGIVSGLGTSFCYIGAIVSVAHRFDRLRSLATAVSLAGAGIGMFCGPLIIQQLLDVYGLKGTFLLVAGIYVQACVFAMLMRPSVHETGLAFERSEAQKGVWRVIMNNLKMIYPQVKYLFSNKAFVFSTASLALWGSGVFFLLVNLPAYSVLKDVATKAEAAFLVTCYGIANCISRLAIGFVTNKGGLDSNIVYTGQILIAAIMNFTFPLYSDIYTGHLVFCIITGFYTGGINIQYAPLAYEVVGPDLFATGLGIMLFLCGIVYLASPPLIGLLVDNGVTYEQTFIIIGTMFLIAGILSLIAASQQRPSPPVSEDDHGSFTEEEEEHLNVDSGMKVKPVNRQTGSNFELTLLGLSLCDISGPQRQFRASSRRLSISTPHLNS